MRAYALKNDMNRDFNNVTYQEARENAREVNREEAKPTITLGFWLALLTLYILWDVIVLRNTKIREVVNPGNIRANLYNIFLIGIASVIFINGFKVLLVKLAAWEIPGISWLAKQLVPLFQL